MSGFLGQLAGARGNVLKEQEKKRFSDVLMQQQGEDRELDARYKEAQIGQMQTPKAAEQGRWRTEPREDGTYLINDLTGEERKSTIPGVPKVQPGYTPKTRDEYMGNQRELAGIQAANRAPRGDGDDNTNWQLTEDAQGNKLQVNPKSGAVRPVMADGQQLRGQGSQSQQATDAAVGNMSRLLDGFEEILKKTGSVVMPGVDKSVLTTAYEAVQMEAKELFKLGVLAGPDLMLMRRILGDPTSARGRAEAMGNPEEHTKRVLAQIAEVRKLIAAKAQTRSAPPQSSGDINLAPPPTAKADASAILLKYGIQ